VSRAGLTRCLRDGIHRFARRKARSTVLLAAGRALPPQVVDAPHADANDANDAGDSPIRHRHIDHKARPSNQATGITLPSMLGPVQPERRQRQRRGRRSHLLHGFRVRRRCSGLLQYVDDEVRNAKFVIQLRVEHQVLWRDGRLDDCRDAETRVEEAARVGR
jgi:hypothetical protein